MTFWESKLKPKQLEMQLSFKQILQNYKFKNPECSWAAPVLGDEDLHCLKNQSRIQLVILQADEDWKYWFIFFIFFYFF